MQGFGNLFGYLGEADFLNIWGYMLVFLQQEDVLDDRHHPPSLLKDNL